jgi:hypothetical protein
MKLLDSAFCSFVGVVIVLMLAFSTNAQNSGRVEKNLKINLDFQCARAIVDLLERNRVGDDDLSRIAGLSGNQRLIKKVAGYNSTATPETFKKTLRQTVENQSLSEDPFDWQSVKKNLPQIRLLINRIEKEQAAFFSELESLIQPYTPPDLKADITATFLVGGGALGFTMDGSDGFHVALHKIGGDYEGLKYLVAHELYHSVQGFGMKRRQANLNFVKPPENVRNSLIIIENTYTEGTATLVGDSLNAKNLKPFGQSQQDEYKKNLMRLRQNFALFEMLLFQAQNDPNADIEQLYNIGFSTEFDETLYYVGYRMAQGIEKYKGKQAIAALVAKNPIEFFNQYIEIYKKNNDPKLIKFSKSTEDILLNLQQWKDKT